MEKSDLNESDSNKSVSRLHLRPIIYGSQEYQEELELRLKVLRRPLGLDWSEKDLVQDSIALHFGAFLGSRLVGCLMLVEAEPAAMRMRQVAVDEEFRGLSVGRKLVELAEFEAKARGIKKISLSARLTALPFYRALGYVEHGEQITEVTIPHKHMEKHLDDRAV